MEQFEAVLGWCSVINIALLFFAFFTVTLMRDQITHLHARMFGFGEKEIPVLYFEYLGHYKLLILIFNLAPYLAMKIVL